MIKSYVKEVKREIENKMPDYNIREVTVVKRNDNMLYGLSIEKEAGNPSPTFYLNDAFMMNCPSEQAAEDILNCYWEISENPVDIDESKTMDLSFEAIKDNLSLRLLDMKLNSMYAEEHPVYQIGNNFAYAFAYNISDDCSIVLTKDIMDKFDLDVEVLYNKALENERENAVLAKFDPFGVFVHNEDSNYLHNGEKPEGWMFVLTNKEMRFGANAIFYPGILEKVRSILGEDFYILPSSIHEVMIIKEGYLSDPEGLKTMLKEGNRELCTLEEVLTEKPFYFSKFEISVI